MRSILITVLALFAAAISGTQSSAETGAPPLRIGLILPLSGGLAQTGNDIREGALFAVESLDSKQQKPELIFEDSQYEARLATSAAQQLIRNRQVDLIVSLWDTADVVAPITERAGVLHASIRWNSDLAEKNPLTFTFESSYKTWVRAFLKLLKQEKRQRVVIISQEAQGWLLGVDAAKAFAPQLGIEILDAVTFQRGESDIRPVIMRALNKKPDSILLFTISPDTELFGRKIKEIRPTQHVTAYLEMLTEYSSFEGVSFVSQLVTEKSFEERFQKRFGHPIFIRAQLAYDLITVITELYNSFPTKPTAAQLAEKLNGLKDYSGVSGPLNSDGNRAIETTCRERVIKGGKGVSLE